ncbi:alkaline-phosphatase-like protein [Radiomyces spectabilis]|uniref:alkaline-phosphatase-like protein n=1 Tax=Radiomyces spectabilis TaxID=64574 RepID=UPI0022201CC4|nr:alkaline-phosphatase-like protein [Radiomyces spectabilis]KAI8381444.1 alkaline-phosphatase-like protein [Radiomyces spectabilis]
MNPSFPSITFPNHWTLVTGLYPEAHGIVANEFYDPELKEQFIHKKPAISQQPKWWGGEPIWTTAASQGKKSAVIMWPGSAVPSHLPTYLVDYIRGTTAIDKMDTTLNWLDLPIESRPQMIAVYIPQIDQKGHGGGPDGPQMNRNLTQVDEAISHLMDGLKKRNLDALVDIVIVSDHGMAPTDKSRLIFYDDILSTESLRYLREREAWPMLNLRPVENAPSHIVDQVYEELHSYTQQVPEAHFRVYRREDVPARFHYSSTLRIAPIVTIPDVGYSFTTHDEFDPDTAPCYRPRGIHGYDNMAPEMRAIFMAKGPNVMRDYAPGTVLAPFFNIEVYGFLTRLLALDAAPNNGTLHGQFISVK